MVGHAEIGMELRPLPLLIEATEEEDELMEEDETFCLLKEDASGANRPSNKSSMVEFNCFQR